MRFKPSPRQVRVGDVWHDPNNRHDKFEEDHTLWFDSVTGVYFVAADVEHVSGPHVSLSHYCVDATVYSSRHLTRKYVIDELIRLHRGASS